MSTATGTLPRWLKFLIILVVLGILGTIFSAIARHIFLSEDVAELPRIAVIAPLSGPQAALGQALVEGAQQRVDALNADSNTGDLMVLEALDSEADPDKAAALARQAAGDPRVTAVIGPWQAHDSVMLTPAIRELEAAGVPMLRPGAHRPDLAADSPWLFTLGYTEPSEARFLANYTRNVLGEVFLSIVEVPSAETRMSLVEPFAGVYERFGTPVRHRWTIDPAADPDAEADRIVRIIGETDDAGAILLAVPPEMGAKVVSRLRAARQRNRVVAPSLYATHAFSQAMEAESPDPLVAADRMDGLVTSVPLLLDIANEAAQNVKNVFQEEHGRTPDWLAAFGYESAHLLLQAFDEAQGQDGNGLTEQGARQALRDALAGHDRAEAGLRGITGRSWFDAKGQAQKPVRIGIANGTNVVSALTQLQPIERRGDINYIEELKKGRLLYVNDRFMYRTNVVYTGMALHTISDIDLDAGTAKIEFSIWFRYSGAFEPQEVIFLNAVDPIKLEEPEQDETIDGLTYRLYRVEAPFLLDFLDAPRPYGSHIAGVSFRHETLDRNNLLYVGDVLGMNLESGASFSERLRQDRVTGANSGWRVDRAWLSQEVFRHASFGKPAYVGHGSEEPLFSRVDLGVQVAQGTFDLSGLLPTEYFLYILVFSLLGTLFAVAMDHKKLGRYWLLYSFSLRIIFWPLLLLSAGSIALDVAYQRLEPAWINMILEGYKALWWMIPAQLLCMALERFLWQPVENRTGRAVPNVIRLFVSSIVYTLAMLGILAFVYDQKLTSLLATGGLLTMIIGLAIQANISNVFSGVFLNVERPFSVGDWVLIGDSIEGHVIDMTWRTTRVRTRAGYVLSIPNGQVSDARIQNFSAYPQIRIEVPFTLAPGYEPSEIAEPIEEALARLTQLEQDPVPNVRFIGLDFNYDWVAHYEVQFWLRDYEAAEDANELVITTVRNVLHEIGATPWTTEGRETTPRSSIPPLTIPPGVTPPSVADPGGPHADPPEPMEGPRPLHGTP